MLSLLNIKIIHPVCDNIQLCCWTSLNVAPLGRKISDIWQVNLTNRLLIFNKLKIEALERREAATRGIL